VRLLQTDCLPPPRKFKYPSGSAIVSSCTRQLARTDNPDASVAWQRGNLEMFQNRSRQKALPLWQVADADRSAEDGQQAQFDRIKRTSPAVGCENTLPKSFRQRALPWTSGASQKYTGHPWLQVEQESCSALIVNRPPAEGWLFENRTICPLSAQGNRFRSVGA